MLIDVEVFEPPPNAKGGGYGGWPDLPRWNWPNTRLAYLGRREEENVSGFQYLIEHPMECEPVLKRTEKEG
jgi:hypothetical protein